MPLRAIFLIAFLVMSLPICFFRPVYGILLWICLAFVNPQSFSWAFDAFPWAAAVAVPTILGMLVFDRKFDRFNSAQFWLLVLLWMWFTVTTVVSTNTAEFAHHATDTWDKWKFVSKILVMTACTIPIVSSFQRLRYLLLTIAACFGLYVVKALPFIIMTGGAFRLYGPERSMIADNNDFGLALNMTLPIYFFLAQTESKPWVKRMLGILFLITIPAIFFTYSRGAMIGLAAVLLLMLLRSSRRLALIPVLVLGVVVAVYFAPDAWQERMNPNRPDAVDASARSRLEAWAFARALAADYPITGGGFATFTQELFDRYDVPLREIGPHSVFFQVLAEHGYVGLALYLSLILSCFVTTRRLRKRARLRGDQDVGRYAQMLEFSLIGFLASGVFLGRAYFDYFFTIVACVIILGRLGKEREAAAAPAESVPPATSREPGVAWAT
jgi:probable O-glycosylation ligase (exosortase A-associated)